MGHAKNESRDEDRKNYLGKKIAGPRIFTDKGKYPEE